MAAEGLPEGLAEALAGAGREATGTLRDLLEQPSFTSAVLGFYHAVCWTDPFVVVVLSWHVLCLAYLVLCWRNTEALLGLWFTQLMLVFMASWVNEYCSASWALFASQDYFDTSGLFISTIYSLPMLLMSLVILARMTWQAGQLLIQVKSKQIKGELKAKHRREKAAKKAKAD
eukprot:CAMPEP_0114622126 /NCGR_PEP_ID=MMETSP0168-20121206/9581_1 /TAXON_ID=95228 ORGANISM="Vannella sp., Strain DIVA3 517/6/12" /NCGR_SAMPLE_ID=MMETSP0168 /ASSEMBLY_ACC=CAM_ASM_000044 /LENGTH=172 /DNA_ID=CAMNT_0001833341 /DNA_START=183 /DNA_END=701 /DNA_ORIENTATION=-